MTYTSQTLSRLFLVVLVASLSVAPSLHAFCGFYVAKADTKLFNKSSQVVLAREGDRTVITMANDYQGDPKEFAFVVPVPTLITREQINVADMKLIDHLDAYTSPRLVEYHDNNPCDMRRYEMEDRMGMMKNAAAPSAAKRDVQEAKKLGVTIEASYTVGEYDILILSAKESGGLVTWLNQSGYKMPNGAEPVLKSYLNQNMKFFVAKVNLGEQQKLGYTKLRPLQIAYESPKFMLPIRLGTVNANGTQDLFIFVLSPKGRVETTNYRTVRMPSNMNIPTYLKDPQEFAEFYKAMFTQQVKKEDMRALFLEYAWDMSWCDPCAADPLSNEQLRNLGVMWLDGGPRYDENNRPVLRRPMPMPRPMPPSSPANVFVTRLHVRYDGEHFPEDLVFQETSDRENFQGRYVMQMPYDGSMQCSEAARYKESVITRQKSEAETLVQLTGWDMGSIRQKQKLPASWNQTYTPPNNPDKPVDSTTTPSKKDSWWKRLWQ